MHEFVPLSTRREALSEICRSATDVPPEPQP
jgi:hypothetical protein